MWTWQKRINLYLYPMTYKINKPKPVKVPPTTISVEMTEREARLLYAFLGGFTSFDFQSVVNKAIERNNFNIPQITNANSEDSGYKVYSILDDAFRELWFDNTRLTSILLLWLNKKFLTKWQFI